MKQRKEKSFTWNFFIKTKTKSKLKCINHSKYGFSFKYFRNIGIQACLTNVLFFLLLLSNTQFECFLVQQFFPLILTNISLPKRFLIREIFQIFSIYLVEFLKKSFVLSQLHNVKEILEQHIQSALNYEQHTCVTAFYKQWKQEDSYNELQSASSRRNINYCLTTFQIRTPEPL